MTPSKLKQLKKRRDAIRNRLQADILKLVQFGEDEGLTQFEAAHAVLDSMLFKIDQNANAFGGAALPVGLAQTYLKATTDLVAAAHDATTEPAPGSIIPNSGLKAILDSPAPWSPTFYQDAAAAKNAAFAKNYGGAFPTEGPPTKNLHLCGTKGCLDAKVPEGGAYALTGVLIASYGLKWKTIQEQLEGTLFKAEKANNVDKVFISLPAPTAPAQESYTIMLPNKQGKMLPLETLKPGESWWIAGAAIKAMGLTPTVAEAMLKETSPLTVHYDAYTDTLKFYYPVQKKAITWDLNAHLAEYQDQPKGTLPPIWDNF